MDIQNDFHEKLKLVIRALGKLKPFHIKSGVQPVIEYHKVMKKIERITFNAVAGNVVHTLVADVDERISILYGRFKIEADATVISRRPRFQICDTDGNVLTRYPSHQNDVTASNTGYTSISHSTSHDEGTTVQDSGHIQIVEEYECNDYLHLECVNGQAGDQWSGFLRYESNKVGRH